MALFGDGITFEPLTGDDLDDIAGLAADAWYSPDGLGDMTSTAMEGTWLDDSERDRVARLMATDEIAAYLQEMTWGVKALLKGKMVGVIVTHGTHTSAETAEHFGHVGAEARKRAEELLTAARERAEHPDNIEPTEPIYLDEIRATKEMRAEADLGSIPRILLLVVSAEARGHGLGKRLINRALDHFRRHGAERYWLVTDTDCDWTFYEHLGLERLADRPGMVPGAPEHYFVYGGRA